MEFKTVLMIGTIAVFAITILRKIAKDEVVNEIVAIAGAILFVSVLAVSFLFVEDRTILWALMFGFWACESESNENNMRG